MQSWLLNTGSLTERLQSLCTDFRVEVLGQSVLALDGCEKNVLIEHGSKTWQIREVILFGDGKPWVFARSALPDSMCTSTWANLGNQPLGQRIFNDPSFVRSDFEIGHVQAHPLPELAAQNDGLALFEQQQRWARRSVFTIDSGSEDSNDGPKTNTLLVAEAFLPDCPCYRVSS